jgi:hypothetical protein
MERSRNEWLVPLAGVAFVVLMIIAFTVGGEPKSADEPVNEVVDFYVDNKSSVETGAILAGFAMLMLVVFAAYLRRVLRDAGGPREIWSAVSFAGLVVVAIGFAIDITLLIALAESAEDVNPVAVQALQALYDNDFVPIALGAVMFLLGTGAAILQSGVLPKWLGWLMLLLVIVGVTPLGFVSAIGAALLVLALGIVLSLRARSAAPPAATAGGATGAP